MFTIQHFKIKFLILFVFLSFLAGCTSLGAKMLPGDYQSFNVALQRSNEEQILLNLVRMQYGDSPYFVSIDSISAQAELARGASIPLQVVSTNSDITGAIGNSFVTTAGITPSIEYAERPTISYSPLQGEKFTRQMLRPIRLEDIYLLLQSGWSIARVLRVTTQAVGDIPNAPSASRPNTSHIPDYQNFVTFAHYLRNLELNDVVDIMGVGDDKKFGLDIIIKKPKNSTAKAEAQQLLRELGFTQWHNRIHIVQYGTTGDTEAAATLPIQTRSFLGIMYYLSKSVEFSQQDLASGVTVQPRYPNGQLFDWRNVTQGMMRVNSSTSKPTNAAVAVYYRNRWFYIADNDSDSKQTLELLNELFALQAGDIKGPSPLLTLSV